MKAVAHLFAVAALGASLAAPLSFAQDHHDDDHRDDHHDAQQAHRNYVRHDEWKKGYHMNHADWDRGERIDYHQYHLSAPPRGYEWRQVDGNYVLAAVATGVIASAIVASTVH